MSSTQPTDSGWIVDSSPLPASQTLENSDFETALERLINGKKLPDVLAEPRLVESDEEEEDAEKSVHRGPEPPPSSPSEGEGLVRTESVFLTQPQ